MKNLLKRVRENKKGFTLVEILVVLVIMAILAAAAIPTMVGFIDQAKGKAYVAQAREVYVASQAAVSEQYGILASAVPATITDDGTTAVDTNVKAMVEKDLDGATYVVTVSNPTTAPEVTKVVYTTSTANGSWIITIDGGAVTVTK